MSGEACLVCAAGDVCKAGCAHDQANCGPANCNGCCVDDSTCSAGNADSACGQNGQMCQGCVPNENTGTCIPQPSGGGLCNGVQSCTPANCEGCCVGDTCVVGVNDAHCGDNGVACQACGAGTQCVLSLGNGGVCAAIAQCDPSNCPGCCNDDVCAFGNQDVACGAAGGTCSDCTTSGTSCVAGVCQ